MGTNTGAWIALAAMKYPEVDTRVYGAVAPNVDCSMFVAEVYAKCGYTLEREATAQAAWFKRNGSYTTNLKDVQIGDAAHWDRGGGKYHTGIIVQTSPEMVVVHATSYGGRPKCIRKNGVGINGIIQGWHFKFIGAGSVK